MHNEMKGKLQSHEISLLPSHTNDCQEREIVLNPVFFAAAAAVAAIATLISWSQCY